MASKERGGLSKREYAAKFGGSVKSSSASSSSSSLKAPKAPKVKDFKFDSSKLVPQYQTEAASIYNPQVQQIQGLQALTKAQAEDAKVKTKDEFAQLLKREQENINRRGAFFQGGAVDRENRIGAQEGGAIRDIGFQEQSANLQYQGTLSEIAQAQKDYVSSKVEGAYSSAYKTFQDKIANQMSQYQLELGQYNTDRSFEQSKIESDRQYALSAAASGRAGANQAQGNLENLLSRASQMGSGGREWAVANAKTFGVNPDDVIRATYGTKEQPVDNWETAYNPNFGKITSELTPSQVNQFNAIVGKYNASPLIAASDRTVVLKNSIKEIGDDPGNSAKQLNLAYSYIQALDTYQSAVREGELALVNSIDSKAGQVQNYVQQIQNGQIVRPEVAKQIADAANSVVNTIEEGAKNKSKSFESQANTVGLGPQWKQYMSGFQQSYSVNSDQNPASVNGVTSSGIKYTVEP